MLHSATVCCAAGYGRNIMSGGRTLAQADSGTAHDKESEDYFNAAGEKTLRAYTVSLDLGRFDARAWQTRDETMDAIAEALDHVRKV